MTLIWRLLNHGTGYTSENIPAHDRGFRTSTSALSDIEVSVHTSVLDMYRVSLTTGLV